MNLKLTPLKLNKKEKWLEIALDSFDNKRKGNKKLKKDLEIYFKEKNLSSGLAFCFKKGQEIIGSVFLKERENDINGANIYHVAIDKKERGNGYGKQMILLAFKKITNKKKRFAFISTHENREGFYTKCGMKKYGNIKDRIYLYKKLCP